MMPRPASVVKICGLTRPKDVHACVEAGVGAVGFVLATGPRRLSVEQVKRLVEELKRSRRRAGGERERVQGGIDASSPRAVGVFASASLEEMVSVTRATGLEVLQLHGEEQPDDVERLSRLLPDVRLVKALGVPSRGQGAEDVASLRAGYGGAGSLQRRVDAYQKLVHVLLLDTQTDKGMGGSGVQFPWARVRLLATDLPVMVAGGIGPAEVQEALRLSGASGVDVSSGVEDAPGIKNAELIRELVRRVERFQAERVTGNAETADTAEKGEEIPWW